MAIKETFIDLVLRVKDAITGGTDKATESVTGLADSAEDLQAKLRSLEDQKALISQFNQASTAVDKAGTAYERAQDKAAKLEQKMNDAGLSVSRQKAEFETAGKAVSDAGARYEEAQARAARLADEISRSGVATQQQSKDFTAAQQAVDKTGAAYDKAVGTAEKLGNKIADSEIHIARQTEEFRKAQEAVGRAGQEYDKAGKTMAGLATEAQAAGVDITDLNGAQRENAKQTAATQRALEDYNKELEEGSSKLSGLGERLAAGVARFAAWSAAAAAAGAALAFTALTRYTRESAAMADQLLDTADQLGVSTTRLQELGAAARTVGVDQNQLNSILKDMTKNIGAAADGAGRFLPVLESIGLEVTDLINLSPDEQLLKIAETISKLTTEQQVNVLERMGSGASKLLPLLQNNAVELERIVKAANDRGAIMSEEELQRLAQVEEAMDRINERMEGLRNKLVLAVAPAFEDIGRIVDEAFDEKATKDFQAVVEGISRQLVGWVRDAVANFGELKSSAQTFIDTLQFLGNTGLAVFRGLQAAISLVVGSVSAVGTGIAELVETLIYGLNKIGLASDETLANARARTENLKATTKDLSAQTEEYGRQAYEAGVAAVTAFDNTGRAAKGTADDLEEIIVTAKRLGDSIDGVGDSADTLVARQQALAQQITETVKAIEAASEAWKQDPSDVNLARLEELREKYQALQASLSELSLPDDIGTEEVKDELDEITQKANQSAQSVRTVGDEVAGVGEKAARAGDVVQEVGTQATESASSIGSAIADIYEGWSNRLAALSEAAADAFKRAVGGGDIAESTDLLSSRLEEITRQMTDLQHSVGGSGLTSVMSGLAQKGLEVERTFLHQARAAEQLTERIVSGEREMYAMNTTADSVRQRFNLLDDTRLENLMSSIQSVQREVESLKASLDDSIASARQELAALEGDTAEVERLRYLEKQSELQEQYNRARQTGDEEAIEKAQELQRLADQAHDLRMRQAKEQATEARQRAAEQAAEQEQKRQRDEVEERQTISRTESQVRSVSSEPSASRVVKLQFTAPNGTSLGSLNAVDDQLLDQLLARLENSRLVSTR
jgi:hypothetical protein